MKKKSSMAKVMGSFRDSHATSRLPGPGSMYRLTLPHIGPADSGYIRDHTRTN